MNAPNVGSHCTVFCIPVNIEQRDGERGRECLMSGGSRQGIFIVTLGMGGPSILVGIVGRASKYSMDIFESPIKGIQCKQIAQL